MQSHKHTHTTVTHTHTHTQLHVHTRNRHTNTHTHTCCALPQADRAADKVAGAGVELVEDAAEAGEADGQPRRGLGTDAEAAQPPGQPLEVEGGQAEGHGVGVVAKVHVNWDIVNCQL